MDQPVENWCCCWTEVRWELADRHEVGCEKHIWLVLPQSSEKQTDNTSKTNKPANKSLCSGRMHPNCTVSLWYSMFSCSSCFWIPKFENQKSQILYQLHMLICQASNSDRFLASQEVQPRKDCLSNKEVSTKGKVYRVVQKKGRKTRWVP